MPITRCGDHRKQRKRKSERETKRERDRQKERPKKGRIDLEHLGQRARERERESVKSSMKLIEMSRAMSTPLITDRCLLAKFLINLCGSLRFKKTRTQIQIHTARRSDRKMKKGWTAHNVMPKSFFFVYLFLFFTETWDSVCGNGGT